MSVLCSGPGARVKGVQHPGKKPLLNEKLSVKDRRGGQVEEPKLDSLVAQPRGPVHGCEAVVVIGTVATFRPDVVTTPRKPLF